MQYGNIQNQEYNFISPSLAPSHITNQNSLSQSADNNILRLKNSFLHIVDEDTSSTVFMSKRSNSDSHIEYKRQTSNQHQRKPSKSVVCFDTIPGYQNNNDDQLLSERTIEGSLVNHYSPMSEYSVISESILNSSEQDTLICLSSPISFADEEKQTKRPRHMETMNNVEKKSGIYSGQPDIAVIPRRRSSGANRANFNFLCSPDDKENHRPRNVLPINNTPDLFTQKKKIWENQRQSMGSTTTSTGLCLSSTDVVFLPKNKFYLSKETGMIFHTT